MKTDYIIVIPIILALTILNIVYLYTTDNFDNFDIFTPTWINTPFIRILSILFLLLITYIIVFFITRDRLVSILFSIILVLFLGITDNVEQSRVVEMFILATIILVLLLIALTYKRRYITALPIILYSYVYISIVYIKNNYI